MVCRGIRLHPDKQNCLVLDFGGDGIRHGPVDQMKIVERSDKASGERIAESVIRYPPDEVSVALVEDLWRQMYSPSSAAPEVADPGQMPERLLRVPGFVSEVMDYCLATAPYPNVVMAFCGALALQAFLAGRKVRDQADNRTNIYLLGLAHSEAGSDYPRTINTRILHHIRLASSLGDRFASGEGIPDAMFV